MVPSTGDSSNRHSPKWKHEMLREAHKTAAKDMFECARKKNVLFRVLVGHPVMQTVWPILTAALPFCLGVMHLGYLLKSPMQEFKQLSRLEFIWSTGQYVLGSIALMIEGILSLQLAFIMLHIQAHALFLEYDEILNRSPRLANQGVLFWIAFYHHHHDPHKPNRLLFTCDDHYQKAVQRLETSNWCPEMSYHTSDGLRNVLMSHWCDFSLFGYWPTLVLVSILTNYWSPMYWFFVAGYELAVLLLPGAHAFQHLPEKEFSPWMYWLFCKLARAGWFATAADHHDHHIHNGPTVWQKFSSSGFYWPRLDEYLDRWWDEIYHRSTRKLGERPYDLVRPYAVCALIILHLVLPAAFCLPFSFAR